ncbi:MAG: hypothetical protein JXA71_10280 [Chitinispirillaceae bacterium]|nr:hypothetical protein [Chitinispirillaceae bacterium]
MNENDTLIIRELKDSYDQQLRYYRALTDTVRNIMGRLVLSRGDFGSVTTGLTEKRRLLTCIEEERTRTAGHVRFWQERKEQFSGTAVAQEFDGVLRETENNIRDFLDAEEQLKHYIEGILRKATS